MFQLGASHGSWRIWATPIAFVVAALLVAWSLSPPGSAHAQTTDPCLAAHNALIADDQVIEEKIRDWEGQKSHIQFFRSFPFTYEGGYANAITERRPFYDYRIHGKSGRVPTFAADFTVGGKVVLGGWPQFVRSGGEVLLKPGGGDEPGRNEQGRIGDRFGRFDSVAALNLLDAAIRRAKKALHDNRLEERKLRKCCSVVVRPPGVTDPFPPVKGGLVKPKLSHSVSTDALARCQPKKSQPTPMPTTPTTPTAPTTPTNPTAPTAPGAPTSSVRVQVDMYRMVFNNGSVQGAGTVTSDPAGISCSVSRDYAATAPAVSGTCAASFAGGTHLTLTASAEPQSSVFHGWSDAAGRQATAGDPCFVQGTGPCVLDLGASGGYEIGASFGLQTRVLTIANPDQTHGEVLASAPTGGQQAICGVEGEQCSVVYPFGQPVIVEANGQNPPITGYGLEGCDAPFPGTTPCQVTMTTAKTLVVSWVGG
jgi:hypothetical protein